MKKSKVLLVVITMTFMAFGLSNCGDDEPLESCTQKEICSNQSVTACCDESTCIYKFDGKDYPEVELDQLADDLGCTGSGARVAAGEREMVLQQLKSLMKEAKAGL